MIGAAISAGTMPQHDWQQEALRCVGYKSGSVRHPCTRRSYFVPTAPAQLMCGACAVRSSGSRHGYGGTPPTVADIRAGTWLPDPVAAAVLAEMGGRIAVCGACDNVRFMDMDVCDRCADAADGGVR